MGFTTIALNDFLQGFKDNFTSSVGALVAKTAIGNFISATGIEFGTISNGSMDLTENAVLNIPAGAEVNYLALYTGQVTDQESMDYEEKLAEISFPQGTYVFTNDGTLTITSFEISIVDNN